MHEKMVEAMREYASDCGWGDESCFGCSMADLCEEGCGLAQIADAMEELIKQVTAVEAERNAAMKRLCEWCGVGCSMENRRAELCEIAAVGLEFQTEDCVSPDWATCHPEPPKEEE